MLIIEKVVKLLDDFHLDIFREHLKHLSVRSYYPLALVDAIDRDVSVEQDSGALYRAVYGDPPAEEKDMKKFFQLGHHTFRLTGFLARNYPDYLQHNISSIQHLINTGRLDQALRLAQMLRDVAEKVEDFSTETKVLSILAQAQSFLESYADSLKLFERTRGLLVEQSRLNELNVILHQRLTNKSKDEGEQERSRQLAAVETILAETDSQAVAILAKLTRAHLHYLHRSPHFFSEQNFVELEALEVDLQRQEHLLVPFLHNLRPKIHFLKLHYSIRQLDFSTVLSEARSISEVGKSELFWNSFINLPEVNSIAIQSSYLVSHFFTSYREDHLSLLPDDIKERIEELTIRCEEIFANPLLEERFVQRYVGLRTVYSGLLLLGAPERIQESVNNLESLLLFFQQVPFRLKLDAIYTTLIMGNFCLRQFEQVEKNYRRYKKTVKGQVVNRENDLTLHGFYFAAKWLETSREQYAKKLGKVLAETSEIVNLKSTHDLLRKVVKYFKIPVT